MEEPIGLVLQSQLKLASQPDVPQIDIVKSPEDFIVISGEIVHNRSRISHLENSLDDFPMSSREITFFELPGINNIAIQDQPGGLDAIEIRQQFFRPTSIGTQVG